MGNTLNVSFLDSKSSSLASKLSSSDLIRRSLYLKRHIVFCLIHWKTTQAICPNSIIDPRIKSEDDKAESEDDKAESEDDKAESEDDKGGG